MAHVKADRVQESTTTTGTGALTLAGATTKHRAFSAALADTDTCVCLIEHMSASEWEVSLCTFASGAGTLTRSTIYASTNSGSAVNFAAGLKIISLLPTASKMIVADNTGATTIPGALLPASNDGGALGSATLSISDGFFASGALLNFANGNYTVTHSSGILTFSGQIAASGQISSTRNTNGGAALSNTNSNVGTAASAYFAAIADAGSVAMYATSSGYTPSGIFAADAALIRSSSMSAGLFVGTGNSGTPVSLYTADVVRVTIGDTAVTFADGINMVFNTTTGTKIGTSTTQKIGFFNATPIVKPTGVAVDAAGIHAALVSLGLIAA